LKYVVHLNYSQANTKSGVKIFLPCECCGWWSRD